MASCSERIALNNPPACRIRLCDDSFGQHVTALPGTAGAACFRAANTTARISLRLRVFKCVTPSTRPNVAHGACKTSDLPATNPAR